MLDLAMVSMLPPVWQTSMYFFCTDFCQLLWVAL